MVRQLTGSYLQVTWAFLCTYAEAAEKMEHSWSAKLQILHDTFFLSKKTKNLYLMPLEHKGLVFNIF